MNNIIEELKKFFKNPKNTIILLFGPLFFTFLFGYIYSNEYLNHIPTAVLDLDKSTLSRSLIQNFKDNQRYDLKYVVNDLTALEELIEEKKVQTGLFIPPGFEKDIKAKKGSKAALIVDGSNIAIGNNGLATGSEILNTFNAGITINFLKGKEAPPQLANNYAQLFKMNSRTLWDSSLSYKTYMLPGMILIFVQQLFLSVFVVNYIEDRRHLWTKALIHIMVGVLAYVICYLTLKLYLKINIIGHVAVVAGLVGLYLLSLTGIGVSIACFTQNRLKATQICMMMSLPTFMTAGYIWPVFKMPIVVTVISKVLWPLIYLVSPLRDYMIKGVFPTGFKTTLFGLVIFTCIWNYIGFKLSQKLMETNQ